MNKRHYEHTLPNIRGSLSNTYFVVFIILYMVGINQWICIGFGVVTASVLVWATFALNEKYGEHGLMKLLSSRQHPRFLINRITPRKLFKKRRK